MIRFLATTALACILLALIANASAYRTTITTVEFDDQSSRPEGSRCREQIQRVDLSQCKQYVSQSRPRLALRGIRNPQQQEQEPLSQCCRQINQIESECQCDALQSVVQEQVQQQRPERGREQEVMEQVMRRASDVQRQCRLPDCQSQSIWF